MVCRDDSRVGSSSLDSSPIQWCMPLLRCMLQQVLLAMKGLVTDLSSATPCAGNLVSQAMRSQVTDDVLSRSIYCNLMHEGQSKITTVKK